MFSYEVVNTVKNIILPLYVKVSLQFLKALNHLLSGDLLLHMRLTLKFDLEVVVEKTENLKELETCSGRSMKKLGSKD